MTIHYLKLEGTDPQSWGHQQGETLKTQIRELNAIRQELLAGFLKGWSRDEVLDLCREHAETLAEKDPALFAEAKGIADTTGVSIEDLMALNAYTDMRDFSAGDKTRSEDGCSILAAKSPTVNFCAQTWDMHGSATPYMLLLEIPGPIPMHVLTITGCLGLAGVNDQGLSVMINNMHCRETNRKGIVWPALVRKMLATTKTSHAAKVLADNIPSSGHNYMIFDRYTATDIETSGKSFESIGHLREKDAGYLMHTNHYVGALREIEILDRQSPSTHARYDALKTFAGAHPIDGVTSRQLIEGLFVKGSTCHTLNIPPNDQTPHAGATCGGIIVDHVLKKATAFGGLYPEGKHFEWKLNY
ncbi:MAG: C45 family peptidase [Bdellovibrionota bacterium]